MNARLRRMPHLRDAPTAALTGFDAHVSKPVDPAGLPVRLDRRARRG